MSNAIPLKNPCFDASPVDGSGADLQIADKLAGNQLVSFMIARPLATSSQPNRLGFHRSTPSKLLSPPLTRWPRALGLVPLDRGESPSPHGPASV